MKSNGYLASLKSIILISILLNSSLNIPSYSATFSVAPNLPKALCRIEVGDAHISTSILRHQGVHVVKVNASSICNVWQNRVTMTLEIYKIGEFSDYFMHRAETDPMSPKSNGLIVKIQDAKVMCTNATPSSYYGIVYAKALIQGKWHYAGRTRSVHIAKLNCGN